MFITKQNMSLKCKTIWQSLHIVTLNRRRTHHVKSNQKAKKMVIQLLKRYIDFSSTIHKQIQNKDVMHIITFFKLQWLLKYLYIPSLQNLQLWC